MNNNVLPFDNWEKPENNGFYIVSADPNRPEYNSKIPKAEKFSGKYAVKKRLEALKELCDLAFWVAAIARISSSVKYSISNSARRCGFVELHFENGCYLVSEDFSPTGIKMFKSLFLHADRIDIRSYDFRHAAIVFYIDNLWVDIQTAQGMDQDDLLLPNEIEAYWDNLRNNMLKQHQDRKEARKAAEEMIRYNEFLEYVYENMAGKDNKPIPDKLIDPSILPKTLAECNVVRDALLTLHYQYGIGTEVVSSYITAERANRIGAFGYSLRITNSAEFDSPKKICLLKRCVEKCCAFTLSFPGSTGLISISFDVQNNYRKY